MDKVICFKTKQKGNDVITKIQDDMQRYIERVNSDYGFQAAKKLLEFKTLPSGFRLAGTDAERDAANWISKEMKRIGLKQVTKEEFPVDAWEFKGAQVTVTEPHGMIEKMEAGSFPCLKGTNSNGLTCEVVYVGNGTRDCYNDIDVHGKIVLVDTDAYHSYWYNSLFNQAEARGAVAVIATVVGNGPGTYRDNLVTTQDIMGCVQIPAVMLNKRDGDNLRELLKKGLNVTVNMKADITITEGKQANYVHGRIIGRNPDRYVIVGSHYDAYWDGFLDNASALGSQLTIAKAMIDSGYRPESTIIFLSNGAEEYGIKDNMFDFCTGSAAVLRQHPEWSTNTVLFNNFELSAINQRNNFGIDVSPCYRKAFKEFMSEVSLPMEVHCTFLGSVGADDDIYHKNGVPSCMNICGDFENNLEDSIELYDHTQYDNVERYDPDAFDLNNKVFGLIDIVFSEKLIAPVDLSEYIEGILEGMEPSLLRVLYPKYSDLLYAQEQAKESSKRVYELIIKANHKFLNLKHRGHSKGDMEGLYDKAWNSSIHILRANKLILSEIFKYNPDMELIYGHRQPYEYIAAIEDLIGKLKTGTIDYALDRVMNLNNNYLISAFDQEVYEKIAINAFEQNKVNTWGAEETLQFPNMYNVLTSIKYKQKKKRTDYSKEIAELQDILGVQKKILVDILNHELDVLNSVISLLDDADIQSIINAEYKW